MANATLSNGQVVGPYKLHKELGSGSFADVWRAWHMRLRCWHALKILKWNITKEATRARFFTEGAAAYELSSSQDPRAKYIIRVTGMSEEDAEVQWIAMELVAGGDLQDFCSEYLISIHESLRIIRDIALALQLAHSRTIAGVPSPVFHRDLKPANVLLTETREVRVSDWGLARVTYLSSEDGGGSMVGGTMEGTGMGTPGISAPEQLGGDLESGPAADVFPLGVMAAILIAGFNPGPKGEHKLHFEAVQKEALADVPQTLRELIEDMVRVNPVERPSVIEVIARLEAAMVQYPEEDPPFRPRLGITPPPAEPVPTPPQTPTPDVRPISGPTAAPQNVVVLPEHELFPGTTLGDPPRYGWWVAGAVVLTTIIIAVVAFWPKGQPDAPEPAKEVATVETPVVDPPKPEPPVQATPEAEPTPEPPIVTPTPVVEVAPMVTVEAKPKVEPKPVEKPATTPSPEEPKPEAAKVAMVSATITTHPATAKVSDRIEITAKVAIPDGAMVRTVKFYYRGETGAYQNTVLYDAHDPSKQDRTKFDGTTARATLPINARFGAKVSYKFDVRLEGDNSPHTSAEIETQIPTQ